jgi:pimeloyl-ACP methyl ester carboxylesterase
MGNVISKDGTRIAFTQSGKGQPIILVEGALGYRSFGLMPELAQHLSPHYTVYTYDRRGRGESGDTAPYAVEREVEDIEALIEEAGGSAFVYGISSGGALALEAAIRLGNKVKKLAIYEAPYNSDAAARKGMSEYANQLKAAIAEGRRGDAAVLFMQLVGTPADQVEGMRHAPMWPMFEAVAPTLVYDNAVLGIDGAVPIRRAASVAVPTLVMAGSATIPFMHVTADALAKAIPNAQRRTLEGQTHQVAAEAIAPALTEFFAS